MIELALFSSTWQLNLRPRLKFAARFGGSVALCCVYLASTQIAKAAANTENFQPFVQTIDRIIVINGDVFDLNNPKENKSLYRFANKIHINTREEVIKQFLLFETGDTLSMQKLAESERILRGQPFIYDANIRTINVRPDKVDILVKTQDNWSRSPGLNLRREGGSNSKSISFVEGNFLGYGKRLSLQRSSDAERSSSSFQYSDPNLIGSRHILNVIFSQNSDGLEAALEFKKPFFSLAAQKAYGVDLKITELNEELIDDNGNKYLVTHNQEQYESFVGFSYNLTKIRGIRLSFGYTLNRDVLYRPGQLSSRSESNDSYVWAGSEYLEDRYIKMQRIQLLNQTEDINLGHYASTRVGWSHENLGSDFTGVIFKGKYNYNAIIGPGELFSQDISFDTKLHNNRVAESKYSTEVRYYKQIRDNISNYFKIHLDLGRELSAENEFFLGGDSGVRGYPLKLQSGDKRVLCNVEQRYYTDWHVFQLFYMAALVFADVGRAWSIGDPHNGTQGILKDMGFGLRAASSRSSNNNIIQLDVAFPMDRDTDQIDKYQIVIKANASF